MAACRIALAIVLVIAFGVFLIASSLFLVPYFIRHQVEQQVILTNNSEGFEAWLSPQAPVFIDFYFFNITNSKQFTGNWSVRPKVKQIGPYVYREVRNKSDIEFSNHGRNLRFRQNKWYIFERNMSCGDENDTFTTVNLPLLTVATRVQSQSSVFQWLVKAGAILMDQYLFEVHTVNELLWGYELNLSKLANHSTIRNIFNKFIEEFNGNSTYFGIYVGPSANGTDDGFYVIDTGIGDISSLGSTNMWNDKKNLSYWSNEYCNMINGTDGSAWHPFVSANERLYSFSSDLCRSIYLTCDKNCSKNLEVSSATIPVYRFTPPEEVFADSKTNPDNQGFCVSSPCFESGVLDVSTCRNAPIVMSEPHFYQASRRYQEAIDGLTPSPDCQTFVEVEPNTGVALHVSRKIQINVHLQRLGALREMDSMVENTSMIFPVLWLNEHAKLSDKDAEKYYDDVLKPINIASKIVYVMYAVGGVLLLGAVVWSIVLFVRSKRQAVTSIQSPDIDDDDAQLIDAGTA